MTTRIGRSSLPENRDLQSLLDAMEKVEKSNAATPEVSLALERAIAEAPMNKIVIQPTVRYVADPALAPERKGEAAAFDLKASEQTSISWFMSRYRGRDSYVVTIDTGVSFAIPQGYVGVVSLRSSMAAKGLMMPNSPGIIDPDYRGTVKVKVIALLKHVHIQEKERFAQILFLPTLQACEVCDALPETDRGDGGFGSTGRL